MTHFMLGLLGVVLTLALGLTLTYLGLRFKTGLGLMLIGFLLGGKFGLFSGLETTILVILTLVLFVFVSWSRLRRYVLSRPLMGWFQRQLPSLSADEQVVLQTGGLWWERELFTGRPDWSKLSSLPYQSLTTVEQAFLDNEVNTLCALLDDWEIVHTYHDLPPAVWDYIKSHGFLALGIDPAYGGLGFSSVAQSAIIARIASRSYSAAITIMVPNSVGPAELIAHYGTPAQQAYYLPRLARGEEIPCFALTGPTAGSDASRMTDRGEVCYGDYQGDTCLGVRLNWDKRYITLAPITTLIGLAFKLYDPNHLLGEQAALGITLAVVPAHLPGVERGQRHSPLTMAFMNGPIRGRDVFIPLDCLIGGVKRCGQGWQMMMACLAVGRGISLPAVASATSQLACRMTGAYAALREQFQRPIGEFEGVQQVLGRMGGLTLLINAGRHFTAQAVASHTRPAVASAIAKYHLTEMNRVIVSDAMDIHAGRAVQCGPANYLAHLHISMPTNITVEGANILTRSLIIFGQGVMRCHPYLAKEMMACRLNQHEKNGKYLDRFDRYLWRHVGGSLRLAVRVLVDGLTGGHWIRVTLTPVLIPYRAWIKQLTRMSQALVVLSDLTLACTGKRFKQREALSGRLGDMLSHLYLASAVLYRQVYRPPPDEATRVAEHPMVVWALTYCLAACQQALDGFFDNVDCRMIRFFQRWVFPYGRCYRPPTDQLQEELARLLQTNNPARDRLTQDCYIGDDPHDVTGRVETAWSQLIRCQPLLEKIQRAVECGELSHTLTMAERLRCALDQRIVTQTEYQVLQNMMEARWAALQVDAF